MFMLLGVQLCCRLTSSNSPPIMGLSAENELKEQWKTGSPVGTANGTTLETWKIETPVSASSTCRKVSMESFTSTTSILRHPSIPRTSLRLSVTQLLWSTIVLEYPSKEFLFRKGGMWFLRLNLPSLLQLCQTCPDISAEGIHTLS